MFLVRFLLLLAGLGTAVVGARHQGLASESASTIGGTRATAATPVPANSLTVNGITVAPMFVYDGADATALAWTATTGPNLGIGSSGTAPTPNQPTTGFPQAPTATRLAGNGQVYQAGTAVEQIGTEDFVVEVIAKTSTARGTVCAQRTTSTGATGIGWDWLYTGTTYFFRINDAVSTMNLSSAAVATGTWVHLIIFVDRNDSTGSRLFVNGVASGTADPSGKTGSLNGSRALTIGANTDLLERGWNSEVAWVAVWKQSSWFAGGATNSTQQQAVATARYTFWTTP